MPTDLAEHADPAADNDAMLTRFIASRDTPCPVCGYNLRGLLGNRCPECGRRLVLAVGTTEPRLAAFIAGLVGLSSGLGFSALLLIYVLFEAMFGRRGFSPSLLEITLLLVGAAVGAGGVAIWVRMRKRLGRVREAAKWGWAGAAWLIGITFPVLFLLTVR
ncbi:MAG: hypothetical protein KF869_09470 [Phycisphaeraceae bacterium]|nr:hypothetical protein [Phycisphaeraceae bacterium]